MFILDPSASAVHEEQRSFLSVSISYAQLKFALVSISATYLPCGQRKIT